jgi:hypothetical protein
MTIQTRRYVSEFIGVDGAPIYSAECRNTVTMEDNRFVAKFLGVDGGEPIFGVARCDFPSLGRYPMRFVGVDGAPVYSIGCCVPSCYEISPLERPVISKSGWTASPWGTNPCCPCMELVPDTPFDPTYCCTDYFLDKTLTGVSVMSERAYRTQKPKHFPTTGGVTLSEEHCCDGAPFEVASTTRTTTQRIRYKLLTEFQLIKIVICISKNLVTCGSDAPAMKWIVSSRFVFSYRSWATIALNADVVHVRTVTPGTCFTLGAADVDCSASTTAPCHPDDFDDNVNSPTIGFGNQPNFIYLGGGSDSFERVKFYETLPTETTVNFTNADVGDDCEWDRCGQAGILGDSFCVDVTSVPSGIPTCYCEKSYTSPTTTYTGNIVSSCCGICSIIVGLNYPYTEVTRCDDPEFFYLDCIAGCQFDPCPTSTYSYSTVTADSPTAWDPCFPNWRDEFPDCVGNSWGYMRAKTCAEDASCFWPDSCGSSCGYPKYAGLVAIYPSLVTTAECDFSSRSCCLSAPSWNVYFE